MTKLEKTKKILIILLALACVLCPCGCKSEEREESEYGFIGDTVLDSEYVEGGFVASVNGVIKNASDEDWSECKITFALYDMKSNEIGKAEAIVSGLFSGDYKSFTALSVTPTASAPAFFMLESVVYE